MPTTPNRGTVREVAAAVGRSETTIRKYIAQTTPHTGAGTHPLGLEAPISGITLDVELTRAYAESRPRGRVSKWAEMGA